MPTGSVIALPRRQREGSITDEQLKAVHEAINKLTDKRGGVVVCEAVESENTARNKARSMALLHEETYATIPDPDSNDPNAVIVNPRRYLTAHSIPDPDNAGKFIGAVSIRNPQASKADADAPAPASKPAAKNAPAKG